MHKQFEVHMLTEEGKQLTQDIAREFDGLLTALKDVVPEGRELSLAETHLEIACFFAKKGMAKNFSEKL